MAWFWRGKKEAAKPPDVFALLEEHAARGDAAALFQAWNTLNGLGSVLFGIPVRDIANADAVKAAVQPALERAIAHVPIEKAESVLAAAERSTALVNVAPLRARLAEAARPARAKIEAALAQMTDVDALIAAYQALASGGEVAGIFYGRSWPERTTLLELARERLVKTVEQLPPDRARAAIIEIRRAELGISLASVSAAVSHVDSDEPINAEIEAAIDANPDDPETFGVLGDWLAERGHPRGELIALHVRAETDPALAATASAYVEEHAKELLGVLAELEHDHIVWRRGFIDEMKLVANDEIFLDEQLRALLDHPSGRRLRALELAPGYERGPALAEAVRFLVERDPAHLRHLALGEEGYELRVVDLAPIWSGLPRLSSLVVRGGFKAGPIHHERLARLQVETLALSQAEADQISLARLPALEHLDVWFGGVPEEYDDDDDENLASASVADAMRLLKRADLPRLTHLGLINAVFTDELCTAFATAPLARQLVELDVSHGTMSHAGAAALVAAAKSLPELEKLTVSDNYLDERSLAQLRKTFRDVVSSGQRPDHGERYPGVME